MRDHPPMWDRRPRRSLARRSLANRLRAYAEKDGRGYPDWALRYVPLLRKLRPWIGTGPILEIGANEAGFARFAHTRAIAVDLDRARLHAARAVQAILPVQADAAALPFRDGSMAAAVCVDTLEHVPAQDRARAAAEVVRVLDAPGAAAVAFPAGDGAARSETAIREAYTRYTGRPLEWLEEHAVHGLPDPDVIAGTLEAAAGNARRVLRDKNASLVVWRWMWRVLACGWPGFGNAVWQAVLRFVTPVLCRVHTGVCYRVVLWVVPAERRRVSG